MTSERLETRDWRLEVSEGILPNGVDFIGGRPAGLPSPMPLPTHLPSAVAATVATLFASSSASADAGCLCLSAPTQMRPVKKNNSNNGVARSLDFARSRLGHRRREAPPLVIVTRALTLLFSHLVPPSFHPLLFSSPHSAISLHCTFSK